MLLLRAKPTSRLSELVEAERRRLGSEGVTSREDDVCKCVRWRKASPKGVDKLKVAQLCKRSKK